MTLALRYAVRSDVGLLREGNEDSAYAGPCLLAIADGMGGHAAGEVASALAVRIIHEEIKTGRELIERHAAEASDPLRSHSSQVSPSWRKTKCLP